LMTTLIGRSNSIDIRIGQIWLKLPSHLQWGLDDYFVICDCENGGRLVLCWVVEHIGAGKSSYPPVRRSELPEATFE
jgi:hypothetical protein